MIPVTGLKSALSFLFWTNAVDFAALDQELIGQPSGRFMTPGYFDRLTVQAPAFWRARNPRLGETLFHQHQTGGVEDQRFLATCGGLGPDRVALLAPSALAVL